MDEFYSPAVLLYFQSFYPVNFLRNVAISRVSTAYVFLTDIDFLPMFGLYAYLTRTLNALSPHDTHKKVGACFIENTLDGRLNQC